MSLYPADLPLDKVMEVVGIVKSGDIAKKRALIGYDLWLLQGYAQRSVLGDPDDPNGAISLSAVAKPENFDAVAELEKIGSGAVQAQGAVPWQAILMWALQELVQVVAAAA
jgi:hypothetical protein